MKAHGICVEQPVWDPSDRWNIVSLPLYPDLTEEEQWTVIEHFKECLSR
jgi:hypothetical protein